MHFPVLSNPPLPIKRTYLVGPEESPARRATGAIMKAGPRAATVETTTHPDGGPVPLAAPTRFLGRQPIVDAKGALFGYELLFRSGASTAFSGDPEQATRAVVDQWLMLIPEANQARAFVNCTRSALMDGLVTLLPPENTVLEILEDVEPDPELIDRCQALKQQGYTIALDDFAPIPSRRPFIALADYIKIDFLASDFLVRRDIYEMAAGSQARLLAEKIETKEEMQIAQSEGCSLFQGYFFSHPLLIASRAVPQNQLVYLSLLAALNRVPPDSREIEKLILGDASLCYRVLRLANSAMQGHATTVTSVREALFLIGDDAVRRMVTVAMAGTLGGQRSTALVSMALSRARFCELLAPTLSEQPAQFYLLGILSLLDVLLETTMPRILSSLPISAAMKAALAGDESAGGRALDLVRSLEYCEWQRCEEIQRLLGLAEGSIASIYVEALRWASAMAGA